MKGSRFHSYVSMQPWKLAYRNLLRHARRNLVSGLAIAFGFSGLALMGAYLIRTDHYLSTNAIYTNQTGHISIFKQDAQKKFMRDPAKYLLTAQDQAALQSVLNGLAGIEFSAKFLTGQGLLSTGCRETPFLAKGIDDTYAKAIREHAQVKRWTPSLIAVPYDKGLGDFPQVPDGISITKQISQMLAKPVVWSDAGNEVAPIVADCTDKQARSQLSKTADAQLVARSFSGDFSAVDAFIVAHHSTGLAFSEETSVLTGLSLLQNLFQTDGITYLAVYLKPEIQVAGFLSQLNEKLKDLPEKYEAIPYTDERVGTFYVGVMKFLGTMATFFFVLVMVTIAITVVNFLTVGFLERQREMGTLRAIGYTSGEIAEMFFRESIILILFSLLLGILISETVVLVVNEIQIPFSPPGIAGQMPFLLWLTPGLCGLVSLIVGATGIVSARWKLGRITQVPIVELLRG